MENVENKLILPKRVDFEIRATIFKDRVEEMRRNVSCFHVNQLVTFFKVAHKSCPPYLYNRVSLI
jgi:hypothetical protein